MHATVFERKVQSAMYVFLPKWKISRRWGYGRSCYSSCPCPLPCPVFPIIYFSFSHQVWDIRNRRIRNIFKTHSNSVESVDFSPNGQLVASASGDKTVRIWNMRDGSTRVFSDSAQGLWCVTFSPNGQYIVAGNSTGVLM